MKTQFYTYLIGWSSSDTWYYGRRTAEGCNPLEFWKTYFTSSKYVTRYRQSNGEPDIIEIRKTFNNIDACKKWEETVLRRLNVTKNKKFLNESIATPQMDTTNKVVAKNSLTGNSIGLVSCDDPRYLSGELCGVGKGKKIEKLKNKLKDTILAKDAITNICVGNVSKNHPNILNKTWVGIRSGASFTDASNLKNKISNSNRVSVRTPFGEVIKVSIDDPRYVSREFVGVTKNMKWITHPTSKKNILIHSDLIFEYILDGWVCGKYQKPK